MRRWFLGIGNGVYEDGRLAPLPKSPVDAEDMGGAFAQLGFQTEVYCDVRRSDFLNHLIGLAERVDQDDIVVLYFSGHGFQHENDNFLVPVDSRFNAAARLGLDNISVRWIIEEFGRRQLGTMVVLLDACRATPIVSRHGETKALGRQSGLARVTAPPRAVISYATKPGDVAWTGREDLRNSVYTNHLLQLVTTEDDEIESVFKEVRRRVLEDSGQEQQPWEDSSLLGALYLKPGPTALAREEQTWRRAERLAARDMVLAFIDKWPGGRFVSEARRWLTQAPVSVSSAVPVTDSIGLVDIEGPLSLSRVQIQGRVELLPPSDRPGPGALPGTGSALTAAFPRALQVLPNRDTTIFAAADRQSGVVATARPATTLDVTGLPDVGTSGWARVRLPDGRTGFVDNVRVVPNVPRGVVTMLHVAFAEDALEPSAEEAARLRLALRQALGSTNRSVRVVASPAPGPSLPVGRQAAFGRALAVVELATQAGFPQARIRIDLRDGPEVSSNLVVLVEVGD
ncbi:caspase family protein [Humitalea sp. 24SJ18S-53]|uniref:caspase family protein n=1 Tax=Humitalea sp. 24SJ18S-53 TaxID=3422307 RepID=UPI003D66E2BA